LFAVLSALVVVLAGADLAALLGALRARHLQHCADTSPGNRKATP